MRISKAIGFLVLGSGSLLMSCADLDAADSDAQQQIASVGSSVHAATSPEAISFNTTTTLVHAIITPKAGPTVEIPRNPTDGIKLTSPGGAELKIRLPGAQSADNAAITNEGPAVSTGVLPAAAVSAQALAGRGVRALVTIEGSNAPTEYRFRMDIPNSGGIEMQDDGSVEIYGRDGNTVFAISPVWATDANGADVPTKYRIDGNTLVQQVQHLGFAYPVVAASAFEANCGIISCKLYFDRAQTRNARDFWWLIGVGASACFFLSGPAAPICAVAVAAQAGSINAYAGRFYEDGDCIKLKVFISGPPIIPERHKRGVRNCK